jgi:TnpA family transposase
MFNEPSPLRSRHAAPDAVVQRLANASGADRLAKALTGIRKVDKTIFLLSGSLPGV